LATEELREDELGGVPGKASKGENFAGAHKERREEEKQIGITENRGRRSFQGIYRKIKKRRLVSEK